MPATSILITHNEMRKHQEQETVRPLCRAIPDVVSWFGCWWMITPEGWLRIADTNVVRCLDRIRRRFDNVLDTGMGVPPDDPADGNQNLA
jgi:hypothetical protein